MGKRQELESMILRALKAGDREFALRCKRELDRLEGGRDTGPLDGQLDFDGNEVRRKVPGPRQGKLFE